MPRLPWMFFLSSISGCHVRTSSLSASLGHNVSLPCRLPLPVKTEISWYHLSSHSVVALLTVNLDRVNRDYSCAYHTNQDSRIYFHGDFENGSSLEITSLNQTDAGLYFCGKRLPGGKSSFGRTILLTVVDAGEVEDGTRSWCTELAVGLTAACVLCAVLFTILGFFCICSGKPRQRCCDCVSGHDSLKETGLQYASLKYAHKSHPSAQEKKAMGQDNVIYSTVGRVDKSPA